MARNIKILLTIVLLGTFALGSDMAHAQAIRVPADLLNRGCRLIGGIQGNYKCYTGVGIRACRRFLQAGSVKSCEGEFFNRTSHGAKLNEGYPEREAEVGDQYSFLSSSSDAAITVHQGVRGRYESSGAGEYHIFFSTPNLGQPTRAECDANACGFDSQAACSRRCSHADRMVETRMGPDTGDSSVLRALSCGDEIQGFLEANQDHAYTAWEECNARRAWGRSVTIQMKVRVGMIFTMHNPRTVFTNRGRSCSIVDDTIPYMYSRVISIPASVACERR